MGRAIGLLGGVYALASAAGALRGGSRVGHWNSRGIFLINLSPGDAAVLRS